MHEKQKESFVKRIVEISENACGPRVQGKKRSRFIAREGIAFSLIDECLDLWDNILKDLLVKNDWNKKLSEEYVFSYSASALSSVDYRVPVATK